MTYDDYKIPTSHQVDSINQNKLASLACHKILGTKPSQPTVADHRERTLKLRIFQIEHTSLESECGKLAEHHLRNAKTENVMPIATASGDLRRLFRQRADLHHKDNRMIPAIHALAICEHPHVEQIHKLYGNWRKNTCKKYNSVALPKIGSQTKEQKATTDEEIKSVLIYEIESFNRFYEEAARLCSLI